MQIAKPRYAYICAAGHSGSTLLDLMLGTHSRIESLGEIWQLSKNLALNTTCTCGEPVRSCPLWTKVVARLNTILDRDLMANPYSLRLGYPRAHVVIDQAHQTRWYLLARRVLFGLTYLRLRYDLGLIDYLLSKNDESVSNSLVLFDTVRELQHKDVVVDSSKAYLRALSLYRGMPEHVRIILLTRDGRGVVWSNVKRGMAFRKAVTEWRNQYARALPLLQQHVKPAHLLHVRYESLVEAPERELRRICEFLGQPFEVGMLEFASAVHHSTNGNDIRMLRSSTLRADTEWQRSLTASDLAYFARRAGWLNRAFGYDAT